MYRYDAWRNPDGSPTRVSGVEKRVESTALRHRHMHKIKLEYGVYKKGYCDGHEREDVIENRSEYIKYWKSLEDRMHLWFHDHNTQEWRHVDEFKLKGEHSLNRDSLGPFGGINKIGTQAFDYGVNRDGYWVTDDIARSGTSSKECGRGG